MIKIKLVVMATQYVRFFNFLGSFLFYVIVYSDTSGETVKILLDNGADANENGSAEKDTPLHLAIHQGNLKAAEILINSERCDVNMQVCDNIEI